jgi:dihydropteroate synthase
MQLDCGGRVLDLGRTQVMGILNVTPDSFSDGGQYRQRDEAVAHARELVAAGADLLDVGGESTRPGAREIPLEEELSRVIPVVEGIRDLGVPVSVDTRKAAVMRAAADAGAHMINDVSALGHDPEALATAAELGLPVCLMHMRGTPETMQDQVHYADVVAEVRDFLAERAAACEAAGIAPERIVLDPGIGFAKTVDQNLVLLRDLPTLTALGYPVLVGGSRKSIIGKVLDREVGERQYGDCAVVAWSVAQGANLVRVHDVAAAQDAARMTEALMAGQVDGAPESGRAAQGKRSKM